MNNPHETPILVAVKHKSFKVFKLLADMAQVDLSIPDGNGRYVHNHVYALPEVTEEEARVKQEILDKLEEESCKTQ